MSSISVGDLAQSLQLRRDNARLSMRLNELTQEISTGKTARPDDRLRGDYTLLAAFEADLRRNASVSLAIDEFGLETDARQQSLSSVLDLARDATPTILQAAGGLGPEARQSASQSAAIRFEAAVANVNTQVGGRSLFAGQAVTGPALSDAETILSAIDDAIVLAAATTAEDVALVIDTWFGPGGDYETVAYLGSNQPLSGPTASGEFSQDVPNALDPRLRDVLAGLAMAATIERGVFLPGDREATEILDAAGSRLLSSDQRLVDMRSDLGAVQDLNERSQAELAAERDSLETARNGQTEIDAFEAAIAIEETETQLRSLYALTAKLANLSLTEFIR